MGQLLPEKKIEKKIAYNLEDSTPRLRATKWNQSSSSRRFCPPSESMLRLMKVTHILMNKLDKHSLKEKKFRIRQQRLK